MPLRSVVEVSTRQETGRSHLAHIYKPTVAAAAFAGGWVDASMSSGTPIYNAYVGSQLESTALIGTGNRGVYTGLSSDARIASALFQTRTAVVPATVLLLDYLMFYPLIDLDSTDEQVTIQSASLPRFTDGSGVRIMPVVTTPSALSAVCTILYTNQSGVSGRSVSFSLLRATTAGCILASAASTGTNDSNTPFVPLANGDTGVRSIESITLASGVGGFASFVLVKPLATMVIPEINTCSEQSFVSGKFSVPTVRTGAYLNFAIKTQAAAVSSWLGQIQFVED